MSRTFRQFMVMFANRYVLESTLRLVSRVADQA